MVLSAEYVGKTSFFGDNTPLPIESGYAIVLGFGAFFSVVTTVLVYLDKYANGTEHTSEFFNTAGRSVKTGLTASVIVSQWTWAATLLQSSNVAWNYGVSGPFWYASGATIQVLLFGILAIEVKRRARTAHTMCEMVLARWGKGAHITFLCFALMANVIVTSMLLLGGAATVNALTGVDTNLASFLIPWGVILYTAAGGLKATFMASYLHTAIIFIVLVVCVYTVYVKNFSSDLIYTGLQTVAGYTEAQCQQIFSQGTSTFFEKGKYACGPVSENEGGSYLTMLSGGGTKFGIINIVGNFGTVFVDQSYWQSAIAAKPTSAHKGYLLGGLVWFTIPFALATSLGLCAVALQLPISSAEAGAGLVPPAVATHLFGSFGSVMMAVMLFMAITSTGSAEGIAVSSLVQDLHQSSMHRKTSAFGFQGGCRGVWSSDGWPGSGLELHGPESRLGLPIHGQCDWLSSGAALESADVEESQCNWSHCGCMGWDDLGIVHLVDRVSSGIWRDHSRQPGHLEPESGRKHCGLGIFRFDPCGLLFHESSEL